MVGQGIKEMLKIVHWEEKVFACLSMLTILADVQHTDECQIMMLRTM